MTATAFNAIAQGAVDLLEQAPAVAPLVQRSRRRAVPADVDTAVVVRLKDAQAERGAILGAPVDWETILVVECYARGTEDEDYLRGTGRIDPDAQSLFYPKAGDELVDPLLKAVAERMASDPTLGGAADDLELLSVVWDTSEAADRFGAATLTYLVRHRTENHTLD